MGRYVISAILGGVVTLTLMTVISTATYAEDEACLSADVVTLTPVNRAPAFYPMAAFNRNIEGFVTVMFDVATDGTVENLRVVDQNPPGVFDQGVIEAVQQWQYEPPVDEEGNAVRVCEKRLRMTYDMDN